MMPLRHALAVAVVHIFILSESWALAKNINFYNVRPPLDPTPFPNSFKCFTCENAGDNYNCNRWAEDKWCPQNTQYCLTVHHFTSHGRSTSITKNVPPEVNVILLAATTAETLNIQSCCEGMICNVELPTNHSNAVLAVTRAPGTSGGPAPRLQVPGLPALAWASVLLLL